MFSILDLGILVLKCDVNVSMIQTLSAISVVISHLKFRRLGLLLWLRRPMNSTLDVKLEIKIKAGHHIFAAKSVLLVSGDGLKVLDRRCHLLYQWYGVSKKIAALTATFVQLRHRESHLNTGNQFNILIFLLQ